MPIYTYKCPVCNRVEDAFRHIDQRDDCPTCCVVMEKIIVAPMIAPILGGGDMPGYRCVVTDEYVTSRKRRREIMKEHNIVEAG